MSWTAENIPSLTGKVAVVTGANSGLGLQTTLALAKHHCKVIMACRKASKGEQAKIFIQAKIPEAKLVVETLDLTDFASITQFAQKISVFPSLSLLVNNAGVMNLPYQTTKAGYERQFATNHLGHFALTGQLLPLLLVEPHSRIVTVSSLWHKYATAQLCHLMTEKDYHPRKAYSNSKLANLLFAFELDRRLQANTSSCISVAAHPGYANTALQFVGPNLTGNRVKKMLYQIGNSVFAQSSQQGALPILYASTAPNVERGKFYGPDGFLELRGSPKRVEPSPLARDKTLAKQLWEFSERLTGVHFP